MAKLWRWVVYYIRYSDTSNQKIVSKQGWDERWKAEMNLNARMMPARRDIPGLPTDAIITGTGITNKED